MRPGAVDQVSEFRSQVTQSTYQPFELKIRKDKFGLWARLVPKPKIFGCQINNLTKCQEDFSDTN